MFLLFYILPMLLISGWTILYIVVLRREITVENLLYLIISALIPLMNVVVVLGYIWEKLPTDLIINRKDK